jgi:citrate lyase subunit beta/citryl-CoA lyase
MIRKSVSLDSDSVILDLEDSVPAEQKETARDLVKRIVSGLDWGKRELCVRTNSASTPRGRADLQSLRAVDRIDSFVLPKAEGDMSTFYGSTGKRLIPIVETTKGLLNVESVVGSDGVDAVSFGAADFALSVGGSVSGYTDNVYVKTKIAVAAKSRGVDPIDNVFFDLKDPKGFRRQAMQARDLGFVGIQVIHPSQIPIANQIFSSSPEDWMGAKRVILAYEEAQRESRGALSLDGKLVDEVHYKIAKREAGKRPKASRSKKTTTRPSSQR